MNNNHILRTVYLSKCVYLFPCYFMITTWLEASHFWKILQNGYFTLLAELYSSHFSLHGSHL